MDSVNGVLLKVVPSFANSQENFWALDLQLNQDLTKNN